jgi:hypothetical protein
MSNWRAAAVSGFARFNPPTTCGSCGREELNRTVPMTNGDRVVWMGTGCAEKAAGKPAAELRNDHKMAQAALDTVEETARRAELAAFQAWVTRTTGLDYMRGWLALGGMAKARALYASRTA